MPEDKKTKSKDFMATLEEIFVDKAPFQLPAGVKEWIVKYGPWITLVLLIISLPALLLLLGLSAVLAPAAVATGANPFGGVLVLFALVTLVLQAAAIPGLMQRKLSGWNLVFYSNVISLFSSLVGGSYVSAILGAVISFYILFQIRSYYK